MNKKIALFLVLIYFTPLVLGAVVVQPEPNSVQATDPVIAKQLADMSAKIQALSQKMDTFATKDQMTGIVQAHLVIVQQLLNNSQSFLIIGFIVVGACLIGTWWGLYLYLKSLGRL